MNAWLIRLFLVISSLILVSGCTTGGDEDAAVDQNRFDVDTPPGIINDVQIVAPFVADSTAESGKLAMYSYAPQQSALTESTLSEILASDDGIIVPLKTQLGQRDKFTYTVIVKNDSVYTVNHDTNKLRFVSHFSTPVCRVLPISTVKQDGSVYEVLHDERVYVVTAESGDLANACNSQTSRKRYYELPLDYQVDRGQSPDGEIQVINLVEEGLATAQLIFGFEKDPSSSKDKFVYGYLGYDTQLERLSLFDSESSLVWSQERTIQQFDIVSLDDDSESQQYIFKVNELPDFTYLIQIGLDLFIVDAGRDLLTKRQNQVGSILDDRTHKLKLYANDTETWGTHALFMVDDDDLLIFDQDKIYSYAFKSGMPTRDPEPYTLLSDSWTAFSDNLMFDQFDQYQCSTDDAACLAANAVDSSTWQYFTPCTEGFGCVEELDVSDYCETSEEKLSSQSDRPLCSPTNYLHITELNKPENDTQLLAHLQYFDYVRNFYVKLIDNKLFYVARMGQKELLIRYDFKLGFEQPISLREQVLFGKRATLGGLVPFFADGNMFLNLLDKSSIRSNECYKAGQKVACELDNFADDGSSIICTGKDLDAGRCFSTYQEYESRALFCNASQINDLSCSDRNLSQLSDLAVEDDEEDAKWIEMYDAETDAIQMHLLVGNHQEALDQGVLDEGRLYEPTLYSVSSLGQKNNEIVKLNGVVELALNGSLRTPEIGLAEVFGYIDVISEEIKQTEGFQSKTSILEKYLLEQSYPTPDPLNPDLDLTIPDVIKAVSVGQIEF